MKHSLEARTAALGCVLCQHLGYGSTPAEIHHIRRLGMPRDQAPFIPLCYMHHRGAVGVHGLGRKAFVAKYGLTEEDLLSVVQSMLNTQR